MARITLNKLLIEKMDSLDSKVDEIRTKDLPAMHTAMGVLKVQVEERTGKKATLITAIGGVVAVVVSLGISIFATTLRK